MTGSWDTCGCQRDGTRALDSNLGSMRGCQGRVEKTRAGLAERGSRGCPYLEGAGEPSPTCCLARWEEE